MRGRRGFPFLLRVLLSVGLTTCPPAEAGARRPVVSLGEVSARVAGADPRTETMLRALVARELERIELDQRSRESYVLSASLVRLDAKTSRDGARATCVVSATLRRERSGVLLAMMRGSGTAEDDRTELEGAKERALAAAVHGAVRRLPEAL